VTTKNVIFLEYVLGRFKIPYSPEAKLDRLVSLIVMRDHVGETEGMFEYYRALTWAIAEEENPPISQLLALLNHEDQIVQGYVVALLGATGATIAEKPLCELMEHGNPNESSVRLVSLALEKIGTDTAIEFVMKWRDKHNITEVLIKQDRLTERYSYFEAAVS